jgi:hypothetical protein
MNAATGNRDQKKKKAKIDTTNLPGGWVKTGF